MIRYVVVGTLLFLALSFTIERRTAKACSSSCGQGFDAGCASSCTCLSSSSLSIDALYNGTPCKVKVTAQWWCSLSNIEAKLVNAANGEPQQICSGACTGTSWYGTGDVAAPGGGCPSSFDVSIQLIDDCGNCPDFQVFRSVGVVCNQ